MTSFIARYFPVTVSVGSNGGGGGGGGGVEKSVLWLG
jgi:hypothetical protein